MAEIVARAAKPGMGGVVRGDAVQQSCIAVLRDQWRVSCLAPFA